MFRSILPWILLALSVAGMAQADTIIPGGNVSGIWRQSGSPYLVQGNITVAAADSLMIYPGVEVRFGQNVSLTVNGFLQADGNGDSIIFTSSMPLPPPGAWLWITTSGYDDCLLEFCRILYCSKISGNLSMFHSTASCSLIVQNRADLVSSTIGPIHHCGSDLYLSENSVVQGAITTTQAGWIHDLTVAQTLVYGGIQARGNIEIFGSEIHGTISNEDRTYHVNDCVVYGSITGSVDYLGQGANISGNVVHNGFISMHAYEAYVSVNNNTVNNSPSFGITCTESWPIWPLSRHSVSGNVINGCAGVGIISHISGPYVSTHVSGNTVHRAGSHGLQIGGDGGGGELQTMGHYVSSNYIDSCGGHGIYVMDTGDAFHFDGNTIIAAGGAGIRACQLATTHRGLTIDVSNNLIVSPDSGGIVMNDLHSQSYGGDTLVSLQVWNNTIDHSAGNAVDISEVIGQPRVLSLENNLITSSQGWGVLVADFDFAQVSYNDLWNCTQGYSGVTPGPGSLAVNPLYVDPASNDYHLQSTTASYHQGQWLPDPLHSPCIDAGDPASGYGAEPLPNGNRINMGFEGGTAEASLSSGGSSVSGPVSGTWIANIGPQYVVGDIWVPANQLLTITPGVKVIFTGRYSLTVYGTLNATGIDYDSVLFTATDTAQGWKGIEVTPSGNTHLIRCILEYGRGWDPEPGNRGGAVYCHDGEAWIEYCTFRHNTAECGGAMANYGASSTNVYNSVFEANTASWGGAVYNTGQYFSLHNCEMIWNSATEHGGAFRASSGDFTVIDCSLIENSAGGQGGGIASDNADPYIRNCTIADNSAASGAGLHCTNNLEFDLSSSIIWGNSLGQMVLTGNNLSVTNCDVQGGWPGNYNINLNPAFLDTLWEDYRLQWGSPCLEPEMGAFYFDESCPVCVRLTPHGRSLLIPAAGGNFEYTAWLTNITTTTQSAHLWCDVSLPYGNFYGPVLGPLQVNVLAGTTLSRIRLQTVPPSAPAGLYFYHAYAAVGSDTSRDSFNFFKAGSGSQAAAAEGYGGWFNTGEDFTLERATAAEFLPRAFLGPSHPNPFNATAVIRYELGAARPVTLKVYDTAGRLVVVLLEGPQEAGAHEVIFDGSGLSSGLYFVRMQAGDYTAVQKLVLLK